MAGRIIRSLRLRARAALINAGLEPFEARVSVDVLHQDCVRHFPDSPTQQHAQFLARVDRRTKREPLQYIVGEWPWAGVNLTVRPPVLVPRPETEDLVDLTVHECKPWLSCSVRSGQATAHTPVRVLDMCTGSGAIALAVAKKMRSSAQVVAVDASPHAVSLARDNAAKLGLPVQVVHSRLQDYTCTAHDMFHVVVSNPPYLPSLPTQPEVSEWEDHCALVGGSPHGLGLILDLLAQAGGWAVPGGALLLEVHESHPMVLRELFKVQDSVSESEMTLLPSSGLGPPSTMRIVLPLWLHQSRVQEDERVHAARLLWRYDQAWMDCFGQPRFVRLRRL